MHDIISVPFTDLFPIYKKSTFFDTNENLKEKGAHKGKTYFEIFFKENRKPWFSHCKQSRAFISTINRLRANHYNLSASLFRIKIVNSPKYKCNYSSENINHIV